MLLWGPYIEFLQKRVSMGLPTPAWDRRKIPHHFLRSVWNGFFNLDESRPQLAMHGPLAIEEPSIESWLSIHSITDVDMKIWYYDLFKAMDTVRLAKLHEKTGDDGNPAPEKQKAAEPKRRVANG